MDASTEYVSPFQSIRKIDEDGSEYWSARDLAKVLGYDDYRNFLKVSTKARLACANSEQAVEDHFVDVTDMIEVGKGARRRVDDVYHTGAGRPHPFRGVG